MLYLGTMPCKQDAVNQVVNLKNKTKKNFFFLKRQSIQTATWVIWIIWPSLLMATLYKTFFSFFFWFQTLQVFRQLFNTSTPSSGIVLEEKPVQTWVKKKKFTIKFMVDLKYGGILKIQNLSDCKTSYTCRVIA